MNMAFENRSIKREQPQERIENMEDSSQDPPQNSLNARQIKSILKRHDINLFALAGDGDRFVRLFRDTWTRMPLWARRRILKHWRENAAPCPLASPPLIELSSGWAGRKGTETQGDMAVTSVDGHSLTFFAPRVDLMPDNLVCDLIAHELAHVYQCGVGIRLVSRDDDGTPHFEDQHGGYWSAGDLEDDADETMTQWGFSSTAMDDWALQHGFTEPMICTLEELIAHGHEFRRTGQR